MTPDFEVDVKDLLPPAMALDCTVRFKGMWRLRVASVLFRLAGWVLNTKFEVRDVDGVKA